MSFQKSQLSSISNIESISWNDSDEDDDEILISAEYESSSENNMCVLSSYRNTDELLTSSNVDISAKIDFMFKKLESSRDSRLPETAGAETETIDDFMTHVKDTSDLLIIKNMEGGIHMDSDTADPEMNGTEEFLSSLCDASAPTDIQEDEACESIGLNSEPIASPVEEAHPDALENLEPMLPDHLSSDSTIEVPEKTLFKEQDKVVIDEIITGDIIQLSVHDIENDQNDSPIHLENTLIMDKDTCQEFNYMNHVDLNTYHNSDPTDVFKNFENDETSSDYLNNDSSEDDIDDEQRDSDDDLIRHEDDDINHDTHNNHDDDETTTTPNDFMDSEAGEDRHADFVDMNVASTDDATIQVYNLHRGATLTCDLKDSIENDIYQRDSDDDDLIRHEGDDINHDDDETTTTPNNFMDSEAGEDRQADFVDMNVASTDDATIQVDDVDENQKMVYRFDLNDTATQNILLPSTVVKNEDEIIDDGKEEENIHSINSNASCGGDDELIFSEEKQNNVSQEENSSEDIQFDKKGRKTKKLNNYLEAPSIGAIFSEMISFDLSYADESEKVEEDILTGKDEQNNASCEVFLDEVPTLGLSLDPTLSDEYQFDSLESKIIPESNSNKFQNDNENYSENQEDASVMEIKVKVLQQEDDQNYTMTDLSDQSFGLVELQSLSSNHRRNIKESERILDKGMNRESAFHENQDKAATKNHPQSKKGQTHRSPSKQRTSKVQRFAIPSNTTRSVSPAVYNGVVIPKPRSQKEETKRRNDIAEALLEKSAMVDNTRKSSCLGLYERGMLMKCKLEIKREKESSGKYSSPLLNALVSESRNDVILSRGRSLSNGRSSSSYQFSGVQSSRSTSRGPSMSKGSSPPMSGTRTAQRATNIISTLKSVSPRKMSSSLPLLQKSKVHSTINNTRDCKYGSIPYGVSTPNHSRKPSLANREQNRK